MNPGGSVIIGSHAHFAVPGYGIKFAFPIGNQDAILPNGPNATLSELFYGFLEACNIEKRLIVEMSLEEVWPC